MPVRLRPKSGIGILLRVRSLPLMSDGQFAHLGCMLGAYLELRNWRRSAIAR